MAVNEKQTRKYGVSTVENDDTSSGILSRFKDPAFKSKFFRWLWLPCGMFTLGIVVAQGGPTFLDLQIITDTDEERGSFFFTAISGGYLLGSFAAGAVHGKISNHIVMVVMTIMGGALTIATPYCSDFILMVCIRCITGFCLGGIDCSLNAEHMKIWGNHGQALLQFAHLSFAIGGVVSPAFSAPFLSEKDDENSTSNDYISTTQMPIVNHTDSKDSTLPQTTDVHYAYLIAGIILALTAIPFLGMQLLYSKPEASKETHVEESPQRKVSISVHLLLISLLCAYYIAYVSIENTFSSYLEEFLVKQYKDMTKKRAAYITTFYWATFAVGRFASIFTSKWLTAIRILYLQFFLMIIAFTGFLVSAYYDRVDALTGFTAIVGLSLSAVYPAGFSWTESEIMKVTGRVSGVILVGSSFGSMFNPYIMGYLMKHQSNFWFCYFLAGAVVVTILIFLLLLFFNRVYVNRKYGTFDQQRVKEKEINIPSKNEKSV